MNYRIEGDTLPVVIMNLEAGESIITEGGGMSWMSPNMLMETTTNGGIGKVLGRAFSGDTLFQNIYTAQGGPGEIAVASCFPGSIKAFEITPGNAMILQKSAFLASSRGVELSMHFRKKLGSGLFGGEGFIMQKVSGNGIVFAEFDGHVVEYNLEAGQQIVVDTVILLLCQRLAKWILKQFRVLKICYLVVKESLIHILQVLEEYGFRQCLFQIWHLHLPSTSQHLQNNFCLN